MKEAGEDSINSFEELVSETIESFRGWPRWLHFASLNGGLAGIKLPHLNVDEV
jgi:hypothetical protein